MDAIRGAIDKATGRSQGSKDSGPESGSTYRSSDAGGEPDVGSKSYSRDTAGWEGDSVDRRQSDPNASSFSSREGGGSGYSSGSSGSATGLGGERSTTGYSGGSGRDDNPSYSSMSGSNDDSYGSSSSRTTGNYPSGSEAGLHHSSKERSHRSGNNEDDDDTSASYSRGGATGASIGADETGDMGGGVHGSRGMRGSASHSGRSSGGGMSGGNQSYGSYATTDKNDD
jgi:hypothetical protein